MGCPKMFIILSPMDIDQNVLCAENEHKLKALCGVFLDFIVGY